MRRRPFRRRSQAAEEGGSGEVEGCSASRQPNGVVIPFHSASVSSNPVIMTTTKRGPALPPFPKSSSSSLSSQGGFSHPKSTLPPFGWGPIQNFDAEGEEKPRRRFSTHGAGATSFRPGRRPGPSWSACIFLAFVVVLPNNAIASNWIPGKIGPSILSWSLYRVFCWLVIVLLFCLCFFFFLERPGMCSFSFPVPILFFSSYFQGCKFSSLDLCDKSEVRYVRRIGSI